LYPKEYLQYLIHFHGNRDYFECHEILEEFWKKKDPRNKHSIWVGFIQLAVSNYHHRRGNFKGAQKTLKKALEIFHSKENSITKLGLESPSFFKILYDSLDKIEEPSI
jgi:predicted metal-dependent hydrolase